MRRMFWGIGLSGLLILGSAGAAQTQVQYGKVPDWVLPPPVATEGLAPDGAPLRIVYSDTQVRVGPKGVETFSGYRMKILSPEALALGSVRATWNPSAGGVTVHYLRIIREGKGINVLDHTKFEVIRRESDLEYAVLNGQLTAILQIPGVRVGDEIEFAATARYQDPTLGDHNFGVAQLPPAGLPGAFRIRLNWPAAKSLEWRATKDVGTLTPIATNQHRELVYELRDPKSAITTDGAPARVNLRRMIEFSDFKSWSEISRRLWPLFDKASVLKPDSPIRDEAQRIGAVSGDPLARVVAALQLVQERIRYVYVGLDAGNYTPTPADESWDRRYGDCKAKTALLLGIFRELGIPGEAVLVNTKGGDGTDERLPSPAQFDHVLVRVSVAGKTYWLDGSRLGDKSLALVPPPVFRWALPLRSGGAELERVAADVPHVARSIEVLDIDAGEGFDAKAKVTVRRVIRGDEASQLRTRLLALSQEDASRAIQSLWRGSWIEPETATWRYSEAGAAVEVRVEGKAKLDWEGDDDSGRGVDIPGAGFTPPGEYHRSTEQDQDAPWSTDYPAYRCWATAVRLPPANDKWRWDYLAGPVNIRLGGVAYWRVSDLRDGVVRTVMSKRYMAPEISAAEAEDFNKRLPGFNNKVSRVFQVKPADLSEPSNRSLSPLFDAATDWTSISAPCSAPDVDGPALQANPSVPVPAPTEGLPSASADQEVDANLTARQVIMASCRKLADPGSSPFPFPAGQTTLVCNCAADRLELSERVQKVVRATRDRSPLADSDRMYFLSKIASASLSCLGENLDKIAESASALAQPGMALWLDSLNASVPATWVDTGGTGTPKILIPTSEEASRGKRGCLKPDYPAIAVRNDTTGATTIGLLVEADGRVSATRILHGSGETASHKLLDATAAAYISACEFRPGTIKGVPVRSWAKIQYIWKLQ